jgi:hypothetical protein
VKVCYAVAQNQRLRLFPKIKPPNHREQLRGLFSLNMPYTHKTSSPNNITLKAILIGLVLVIVNAYWVGISSELWYCMFTLVNPFSNAIFTLVVGMFQKYVYSPT